MEDREERMDGEPSQRVVGRVNLEPGRSGEADNGANARNSIATKVLAVVVVVVVMIGALVLILQNVFKGISA